MKCPRGCGNNAKKHPMLGVLPCDDCVAKDRKERASTNAPEFFTISQQTRIQRQRDEMEKDMMLPTDLQGNVTDDFKRAFPEKAKQLEEEYKQFE